MDLNDNRHTNLSRLSKKLCDDHGPLISGPDLWRALGFKSASAFHQAHSRGLLGVRVFKIPNRRGLFAITADVSDWIERTATEVDM